MKLQRKEAEAFSRASQAAALTRIDLIPETDSPDLFQNLKVVGYNTNDLGVRKSPGAFKLN